MDFKYSVIFTDAAHKELESILDYLRYANGFDGDSYAISDIRNALSNLKTLVIEKNCPGGKVVKTSKIENWIGTQSIDGPDLALNMFQQANKLKAQ